MIQPLGLTLGFFEFVVQAGNIRFVVVDNIRVGRDFRVDGLDQLGKPVAHLAGSGPGPADALLRLFRPPAQ